MTHISQKIGFIGCGNMAEAIIRGLITSGSGHPTQIWASDARPDRLDQFATDTGINRSGDNAAILANTDVVILAVKPQNLSDLAKELSERAEPRHLFISILAGIRSKRLEEHFAHPKCPSPRVIRVMPNTPALIGEGASALAAGSYSSEDDLQLARTIFESVGIAEVVSPEQMDLITGLTGSGPAYVFRMIEALIWAAEARGLPTETAERLVLQMVSGAATMAKKSDVSPAELRRRVTSPGGTTAAGLKVLNEAQFMQLIDEVVEAATQRSKELGS